MVHDGVRLDRAQVQGVEQAPGLPVPAPHGAVVAGAQELTAVADPLHGEDVGSMPGAGGEQTPVLIEHADVVVA